MSFHQLNLHPLVKRNLSAMGFHQPKPIQAQAMGPLMEGCDMIGLAPTGTGKTAAFLSPIAHQLLMTPPPSDGRRKVDPVRRLRAMVLCPTRELAVQVEEVCSQIIAGTVLRSVCAYGKVGMKSQREAIERGVDVLVATPGRVRELLEADAMTLAYIRHVAIDEADRMLDMGFLPQVESILKSVPTGRQTMLFTATMPGPVEELAQRFLRSPRRIEIGRHTTPVEHVRQHLVTVEQRRKVELLLYMLPKPATPSAKRGRLSASQLPVSRGGNARTAAAVLVFCRTRRRVGWVGAALQRHGLACGMIHGDRTQSQRLRAIENLSSGKLNVIVSTDVAARGLHIPAVGTVINYDVPPNAEEYVHRIGRAAHGGGRGEAWTLLAPIDQERWTAIRRQLDLPIEPERVEGFEPASSPVSRSEGIRTSEVNAGAKDGRNRRAKGDSRSARPRKRSPKSRPIPEGQKPGSGVVRKPPAVGSD